MKGQIRISVEPEDIITLIESNVNELERSQKTYLMKLLATSMSNLDEWEVSDTIDDLIEQLL